MVTNVYDHQSRRIKKAGAGWAVDVVDGVDAVTGMETGYG